jgi:hypothetical protein
MPLRKIVTKAIVASTKGKVAGRAAANAAEKKAAAAKAAKAAAAANARGLKAAQGPSMAPKGYTVDDARREALNTIRKAKYPMTGAQMDTIKQLQTMLKNTPAPTNIVSKSGKKVINPKAK